MGPGLKCQDKDSRRLGWGGFLDTFPDECWLFCLKRPKISLKTYLFNLKQRKQLSSGRQVDRGGWKGLEAQEGHAPARLLEYEDYS